MHLILALVWAATGERTLSEYQKRDWHVEDGLPQGNVRTVTQNPDGTLLIGTGGGMASFDGIRFAPVKVDQQDEAASEPVNALLYSRTGDLWIGTDDRGVIRRNARGSVKVSEAAGLTQERVRALYEDSAGVVWAATQNGVERIIATSSDERVERLSAMGIVPGDVTMPFASDGAGGMWIVTAKGLFHWRSGVALPYTPRHKDLGIPTAIYRDSGGRVWVGLQTALLVMTPEGYGYAERVQPGSHGPVASIVGDAEGNIWIGTRSHGICRVSPEGIGHWTSAQGLSDNTVRSMFLDREGNLWIGMLSGGLARWRQTAMIPYGTPEGLPESLASTVLAGSSGDLWLGTWGQGLFRLRDGRLTRLPLPETPVQVPIRALADDRDGGIWIGTWYNGLYHFDGRAATRFLTGSESLSNAVSALLVDRAGALWVGTYRGLLKYDHGRPRTGKEQVLLPDKLITALRETPSGEVYAGTSQGLYRFDGGFITAITRRDGLANDSVLSISVDGAGAVWAGTKAGGLDRIIGHRAFHLPERAMPSYPIFSLIDDGRGELWMGSTRGVLRVPRDELAALSEGRRPSIDLTVFGKGDGMRNSECVGMSQPPAALAQDGTLWFATAMGFAHTNPGWSQRPIAPPPLRLVGVTFDHAPQPVSTKLAIPPGASEIDFEFNAVRLADPAQLRFRYKLEKYDTGWTETGSRHAVFKHLPAGSYRLLAEVRDHQGPWSQEASVIEVRQLPYFFEQWWFYALLAAFLAGAVAALFRWRFALARNRVALVIEERNRIAREWHDTLMANFAAISWQLEATQNRLRDDSRAAESSLELARNMVKHCMAQARRIIWDLRDHDAPVGLLSEELTKALSTLGPRAESETRLHVEGSERPLPPVCVHHLVCIGQEAVTNALRHASPHTVQIRVTYEADRISMAIQDDGRGFELLEPAFATAGHFGLAVMHERARKIGGELKIQSVPGAGTEVLVSVPEAPEERG